MLKCTRTYGTNGIARRRAQEVEKKSERRPTFLCKQQNQLKVFAVKELETGFAIGRKFIVCLIFLLSVVLSNGSRNSFRYCSLEIYCPMKGGILFSRLKWWTLQGTIIWSEQIFPPQVITILLCTTIFESYKKIKLSISFDLPKIHSF